MNQEQARWSGKSKGTPLGYLIFITVIRRIGVRAAYLMLVFVAPWYLLTSPASNKAIKTYARHLRSRFPDAQRVTPLASYMAFGRSLVDKFAIQAGLSHRYQWSEHGKEHLQALMASGKGGILIGAHIGNWDLAGHVLSGFPGKMTVVLLSAEYERIQQVMERNRTTSAFNTIQLSQDLSHVFKMSDALREGHLLCMHGDRSLPGARTRRIPFLGKEADFPVGPFALAMAHKVPICISFVVNSGNMRYWFTSTPPIHPEESIEALMERYVAELEEVVRKHPLQWFNYFDFWAHGNDPGERRRGA